MQENTEWIRLQVEGATRVIEQNQYEQPVKYIGGIDISFCDQSSSVKEFLGVATLVVLEFETLKLVYENSIQFTTVTPYISGFLGLREAPEAELLYMDLIKHAPEFIPQIVLVDGCGIYHPRGFGSASQIGVNLDICTIGVSKSFLKLDEADQEPLFSGQKEVSIYNPARKQVAVALFNENSKHPRCYVSVGNRISLKTAVEIVIKCSKFKVPEPIRLADKLSRQMVLDVKKQFINTDLEANHNKQCSNK